MDFKVVAPIIGLLLGLAVVFFGEESGEIILQREGE